MNKLILNTKIKSNNFKFILLLNKRSLRLLYSSATNLSTNNHEILHNLPKLNKKNYINNRFSINNPLVNFIKIQIKIERPDDKKDQDEKLSSKDGKETKSNDGKNNEDGEKQNNDNERDPNETIKKFFISAISSIMIYITLYGLLVESNGQHEVPLISWQEFVSDMLAAGEVEEISK